MDWKVGQEIWVVGRDRRYRRPHAETITKVGRLYFHTAQGRYTLADGAKYERGYSPQCNAYESKDTYLALVEKRRAWERLVMAVQIRGKPPAHLTAEQIHGLVRVVEGIHED